MNARTEHPPDLGSSAVSRVTVFVLAAAATLLAAYDLCLIALGYVWN